MRITFVLPCANMTGGVRVVGIYAERLAARGHRVRVVCGRRRRPSVRQQVRSLLSGRGWIPNPDRARTHLDDVAADWHVVGHHGPITDDDVPEADVVVATWWRTAAWVAAMSAEKGAKAYFMQDYGSQSQPMEQLVQTWRLPLHLITIAQWLVELIHEACGSIPVNLVPNAVDTGAFWSPIRHKRVMPVVGMVYRSAQVKGCDVGLRAFELARREMSAMTLRMFGSERAPSDRRWGEGVVYERAPGDERVREIYASCDAWLFPSRREGFGLPILEAMACRTPVIGTPAGAAPELLAGGGGILVKSDDPQDMARAMIRVCRMTEAEWQRMSDAAHTTATSYSWDDATDLFEAALHTALERHARADHADSKAAGRVTA